jgi:competence protein ComEA
MKRHTLVLVLAALAVIVSMPLAAFAGTSPQAAPANKQQYTPAPAAPAKTNAPTSKTEPAATPAHHTKLDLNAASREELMKLPGMTAATTDKIIAARPFKSVGELESKKLLSPSEYKSIQSHLMVKSTAKPQSKEANAKEAPKPEAKEAKPAAK